MRFWIFRGLGDHQAFCFLPNVKASGFELTQLMSYRSWGSEIDPQLSSPFTPPSHKAECSPTTFEMCKRRSRTEFTSQKSNTNGTFAEIRFCLPSLKMGGSSWRIGMQYPVPDS